MLRSLTPAALAALLLCAAGAPAAVSAAQDDAVEAPEKLNLRKLAQRFEDDEVGTVYFDFDRTNLDPEARKRLDQQALWIQAHPGITFSVTGHTDKVGSGNYNMQLGLRRANRVVNYLVAAGVAPSRLEAKVSYGEEQPVADVETRERRNRRVTTRVVVPKRSLPGIFQAWTPKGGIAAMTRSPAPGPETTSTGSSASVTGGSSETSGSPTRPGKSGLRLNSGRGNGDETGDPGKSAARNKGGDE